MPATDNKRQANTATFLLFIWEIRCCLKAYCLLIFSITFLSASVNSPLSAISERTPTLLTCLQTHICTCRYVIYPKIPNFQTRLLREVYQCRSFNNYVNANYSQSCVKNYRKSFHFPDTLLAQLDGLMC